MTPRWKRILAVRSIQRQMAEIQLHRAETDLRNLVDLGARIVTIRDAAQPSTGAQNGLMLRSICELSERLDNAQLALVQPSRNAAQARDRKHIAVVTAKQREMAVDKLQTATAALDEKCADDRQSRTVIFRRMPKFGAVT